MVNSSLFLDQTAILPSSAQASANALEPVHLALIGVGGFGRTHLRCLDLLRRQGRARLVAVADPSNTLETEKRELTAQGTRWYSDYREMLALEKELRAVQIASPVPLHYEMAVACLDRGLFVHVEKPPVVLIQDLEDLIARDTTERVSVGFQHIDSIQIQTLKDWIMKDKLGRLREIRVSACWPRLASYYERPWAGKMSYQERPVFDGPATNALSHLIHNIMFLAGPKQAEFAVPVWVQGEFHRVRSIQGYDLVALRGEFGDGTEFSVSLTHATEREKPYRIEVRGERDWARLSEQGLRLETSSGIHQFSPEETDDDAHMRAQKNFLDFVAGKIQRPSTRLCDTRGFVLTINGGLLSSEGIRPIPAHLIRHYRRESDDGVDVEGLASVIERAHEEGVLFSDLGVPWARPSRKILLEGLRHLAFDDYLANGETVICSSNRKVTTPKP